MRKVRALFMGAIWVFIIAQSAWATAKPDIPEPLKPWMNWVLYGREEQIQCTAHFNNPDTLQCNWPTEVTLDLHDSGGTFSQAWHIQHEAWVLLPGNDRHWPLDVKVNGSTAVLVDRGNRPAVFLDAGQYMLTGKFSWQELPEYIDVPPRTALISLTVNKEKVAFPDTGNGSGKLWLKSTKKEEKIEDRLQIESYKLIEDRIPARIEQRITLDVAGSAREITLGPLFETKQFIPISLASVLPAKLEENSTLRIQVRPGRYVITLIGRHVGPLQGLTFQKPGDGLWPGREIWSFHAQTDLRIVEVKGVTLIDPQQTGLPDNWRNYPTYQVLPGETMLFKEIKRGDPRPAPDQLALDRTLWLRFDGSGYTIQDRITGRKNTNWRLEITPEIALGRVAIGGKEHLITRRDDSDKTGIELREGMLDLTADSKYQGSIANLPATGWDADFQKVTGRLHLPPGWDLINAAGIDNIPHTWIKRWTLLDFFIVLIFTIALANLFSKPMALLAFITLVLTYHEPNAPKYVWIALLVGFALLRHLPEGSAKKAVRTYQVVAVFLLLLISISYSIQALRIGIYPQLEQPWTSMTKYNRVPQAPSAPQIQGISREMGQTAREAVEEVLTDSEEVARKALAPFESNSYSSSVPYRSRVMQYDPKALTQTGPGIPQWQPFETIYFNWSGPVTRDQDISFLLIGPKTNLVLAFIRVFLIIALALGMLGFSYRSATGFKFPDLKAFYATSALFAVVLLVFMHTGVKAAEFPSQEMLDELQRRLLEKDACFPVCADISDIAIEITPEQLIIDLHVDAQIDTAIPVPSHDQHWLPQKVSVDGNDARSLFRVNNNLWVLVPAGKHAVELSGRIRKQNTVFLPFPLKPHHLEMKVSGWSVDGVHPDGAFDSQLQFKRIVAEVDKKMEILETGVLPSFSMIERNILLDLIWKVETTVRRISPAGSAVVLEIPLLPGESVITDGIRVDNGSARINMGVDQTLVKWESFLNPADSIVLRHAETNQWTELWRVDVSPVYHLEAGGIPVIHHKAGNIWYPTWHPWPGEEVTLSITRPAGIGGRTMTIEKSHLELRPGRRNTDGRLALAIKSSQGGQHTITLPPGVELQEVKINGKVQSIRQEGSNVPLPITPGQQEIELLWRDSGGMTVMFRTPEIDLGAESVNSSVDLHLPRNRWPLFVGGEQLVGPAVLFYSLVMIIILGSIGLSLTGLTPLKFHHWLLLGIGMSMSNLGASFLVVAWLIALDLRKKVTKTEQKSFNLIQVGIILLTILAGGSLIFAISQGLLGHPDMSIAGNGSNSSVLRWYQDVSDNTLPRAWIFSAPMFAYRMAMLAWALWISFALIGILKWGWKRFAEPAIWYHSPAGQSKKRQGKEPKE